VGITVAIDAAESGTAVIVFQLIKTNCTLGRYLAIIEVLGIVGVGLINMQHGKTSQSELKNTISEAESVTGNLI
jgi:ATP:corrinoid adenosyltransferase